MANNSNLTTDKTASNTVKPLSIFGGNGMGSFKPIIPQNNQLNFGSGKTTQQLSSQGTLTAPPFLPSANLNTVGGLTPAYTQSDSGLLSNQIAPIAQKNTLLDTLGSLAPTVTSGNTEFSSVGGLASLKTQSQDQILSSQTQAQAPKIFITSLAPNNGFLGSQSLLSQQKSSNNQPKSETFITQMNNTNSLTRFQTQITQQNEQSTKDLLELQKTEQSAEQTFLFPKSGQRKENISDILSSEVSKSSAPKYMDELLQLYKDFNFQRTERFVQEIIAYQANKITQIVQNTEVEECVQWFNTAWLSSNQPEAIAKLLQNQIPQNDSSVEELVVCGQFDQACQKLKEIKNPKLNDLIAQLTDINRLMKTDSMQIGCVEQSDTFLRLLNSRDKINKKVSKESKIWPIIMSDDTKLQETTKNWQQHAAMSLLNQSSADCILDIMRKSYSQKGGKLDHLHQCQPIPFLVELSKTDENLPIVFYLFYLYMRMQFLTASSHQKAVLNALHDYQISQYIQKCHKGLSFDKWLVYLKAINQDELRGVAFMKMIRLKLNLSDTQDYKKAYDSLKLIKEGEKAFNRENLRKLLVEQYFNLICQQLYKSDLSNFNQSSIDLALQTANPELLQKLSSELISQILEVSPNGQNDGFAQIALIEKSLLKVKLAYVPKQLNFLLLLMKVKQNSDWNSFEKLLDSGIDLKYFKKTFEIILPNLIKSKQNLIRYFCSEEAISESKSSVKVK